MNSFFHVLSPLFSISLRLEALNKQKFDLNIPRLLRGLGL